VSFSTRTVTATFKRADNVTPATGTITFTPNTALQAALEAAMYPATPVRAVLDTAGHISVTLICTDSTDISPSGWAYVVTEQIAGAYRTYDIQLTAGSAVDLSAIAPTVPGTAQVQYVLATAVGAVGGPAGPLDSNGHIPAGQISGGGGSGTPATTVTDETTYGIAKAVGTGTNYAREDHTHGSPSLTAATPAASAVGDSAAVGVATAPARADHKHAREAFATPGNSAVGDVAAAGSSASVSHADHVHGREAFGTVTAQTSFGASSGNGAAATPARSDHVHGTPSLASTSPTTSAVGDSAAAGAGTTAAKADHTHGREAFGAVTAQTAYGAASANGVATTVARSDHAHGTPSLDRGPFPLAHYGLVAATGDPNEFQKPGGVSSNDRYIARMFVPAGVAFSKLWIAVTTAGTWDTTSGPNQIVLYDDTGAQLTTTTDTGTMWATSGWRGGALGANQTAQASDRFVYVLAIIRGVTGCSIAFPVSGTDNGPWFAVGPGQTKRRGIYTAGSTVPASFDPTSFGAASSFIPLIGAQT